MLSMSPAMVSRTEEPKTMRGKGLFDGSTRMMNHAIGVEQRTTAKHQYELATKLVPVVVGGSCWQSVEYYTIQAGREPPYRWWYEKISICCTRVPSVV
jgi:hypothetical protein